MSIETIVLDAQTFSLWIQRERGLMLMLERAERMGAEIALSAATIIEVSHGGVDRGRMTWLLSQVRVESVTKDSARRSTNLLHEAGLHGHKYAIDSMVAEVAARMPAPVLVLTSDVDDMARICPRHIRVVGL
ncbi:MAG: DNA-binding protein [Angustibacter sp.]